MRSRLKERPIEFTSGRGDKKYRAVVESKEDGSTRVLSFGHKKYGQYKDRIGLYSHLDHGDPKRRRSYFARHSGGIKTKAAAVEHESKKSKGRMTPKILSHIYLW